MNSRESGSGTGPVADPGDGPLLLVLADSLSFHGPERAEPANDPRLWPNLAAAALGGRAELAAGFGWTARHAWHALTHDPRLWAVMPHVDALVLGVGGMDTLPSPVPTAVRELIPLLPPGWLRRAVRAGYRSSLPRVARAFERLLPHGGPVSLPPKLSVHYLESCRRAVLAIRPDIPVVLLLPGAHSAPAYGRVDIGREPADTAYRKWAGSVGVAALEVRPLVIDHILGGQGNPDGMHYGWVAHEAIGKALSSTLSSALSSTLSSTSWPRPSGARSAPQSSVCTVEEPA